MNTKSRRTDILRAVSLSLLLFIVGAVVGIRTAPTLASAPGQANSGLQLNELLQARFSTATNLLAMEQKRLDEGRATLVQVCEAARRVRDSALELPVAPAERISALSNYVAVTLRLETHVTAAVEQGAAPASEQESARYLRLDAQIALLRAQGQISR